MMKTSRILAAYLLCLGIAQMVAAQAPPSVPKPTEQHQLLKKFVGHWEMASQGVIGEGQPPVETTATMKSEMLGEFWVVNVMEGNVAGMKFKGVQTIGYDVKKEKYVGTWIDSTNGHIWHYEGAVNETGQKLVLEAEGPNMMDSSKTSKYRDAYEFKSEDLIIATSSMQNSDGKWVTFMTGEAKRKDQE